MQLPLSREQKDQGQGAMLEAGSESLHIRKTIYQPPSFPPSGSSGCFLETLNRTRSLHLSWTARC